jgi:hypothetical protein
MPCASSKSWYPHYFNTEENLEYVGSIPDMCYDGVDDMSEGERNEFVAWYASQKNVVFKNRLVLVE